MKKGITAVTSLLVLSLAGISLVDSQEAEAAAQKDQSFDWKWENHDENMRSHMNDMHGRNGQNRPERNTQNRPFESGDGIQDNATGAEEPAEGELESGDWEDRHERMWEYRNDRLKDYEEDQSEASGAFFEDMRGHMRGFNSFSFDEMNEWMDEMHGSFNFRWGHRFWDDEEQNENDDSERPDRGFMERFESYNEE